MELFYNTPPLDIPFMKTNSRTFSELDLYRLQMAKFDDLLEQKRCFKKQLSKNEAIGFKKSRGTTVDQQSSVRLLVVSPEISFRFKPNEKQHRLERLAYILMTTYL